MQLIIRQVAMQICCIALNFFFRMLIIGFYVITIACLIVNCSNFKLCGAFAEKSWASFSAA